MRRLTREDDTLGLHEINLTPLIDVCLVLVVILLVATPIAFESAIGIRGAASMGKKAVEPTEADRVEVRLMTEDQVEVNRAPVARENLAAALRPLLDQSDSRRVVIACEGDVSHGAFVDVLDQSKGSGAAEIAVLGR